MSTTTTPLMTFEEFERIPDEPGKDELFEGEWIHLPPPERLHMKIARRIFRVLQAAVEALPDSGLGEVCIESGYKFGARTWTIPDVSIEHFNQPGTKYAEGAPALAVEVISESNLAKDMDRKVKLYLANGAREVWLFYPMTHCVWVYRPEGAKEFRDVLRSDLVPGLELDLERIFHANPLG